jgi:hypothetical protein
MSFSYVDGFVKEFHIRMVVELENEAVTLDNFGSTVIVYVLCYLAAFVFGIPVQLLAKLAC